MFPFFFICSCQLFVVNFIYWFDVGYLRILSISFHVQIFDGFQYPFMLVYLFLGSSLLHILHIFHMFKYMTGYFCKHIVCCTNLIFYLFSFFVHFYFPRFFLSLEQLLHSFLGLTRGEISQEYSFLGYVENRQTHKTKCSITSLLYKYITKVKNIS